MSTRTPIKGCKTTLRVWLSRRTTDHCLLNQLGTWLKFHPLRALLRRLKDDWLGWQRFAETIYIQAPSIWSTSASHETRFASSQQSIDLLIPRDHFSTEEGGQRGPVCPRYWRSTLGASLMLTSRNHTWRARRHFNRNSSSGFGSSRCRWADGLGLMDPWLSPVSPSHKISQGSGAEDHLPMRQERMPAPPAVEVWSRQILMCFNQVEDVGCVPFAFDFIVLVHTFFDFTLFWSGIFLSYAVWFVFFLSQKLARWCFSRVKLYSCPYRFSTFCSQR